MPRAGPGQGRRGSRLVLESRAQAMGARAVEEAKAKRVMGRAEPMLSALVVARNEEKQLPACLETLRFADEIVVVLDRTTDRSAEIARMFGARIVEGAWPFEGERRTAAAAACRGEWIIRLDAIDRAETPSVPPAFRRICSRFWKSYVARKGYREGPYGIGLALFSALYPMLT